MSSLAYQAFLAEPLAYATCRYGDDGQSALSLRGPRKWIEMGHTMFANLGMNRKLIYVRENPDPEAEHLAYMSCRLPRVKSVIKTYLYTRILLGHEVGRSEHWDEKAGTFTLHQDEKRADQMAEEDASHFMANLPVQSFIPNQRFNR